MIDNTSTPDLLARMGTDAEKWAAEFAVIYNRVHATSHDHLITTLDPAPGNLLHGWFANAIEAGRTAGELAWQMLLAPGFKRILSARMKQVEAGFGPEHDELHTEGELIEAAVHLLTRDAAVLMPWPWDGEAPTYADRDEELAMASALVLAEIERRARV